MSRHCRPRQLINVSQAQHRYSPAAVIAVERQAMYGVPAEISTSYVERSNLSLRMSCRRFTRLTNAFSKKLDNHGAAVALYVAHYNLCRVHETLRSTPAVQLGITDHAWSLGELIDAALAVAPAEPTYRWARAVLHHSKLDRPTSGLGSFSTEATAPASPVDVGCCPNTRP
jgi:hypothetical protein